MSNEAMKTILEITCPALEGFITDENLDMLDEFTEYEIADIVLAIAERLTTSDTAEYSVKDYHFKVYNTNAAWVSCSDNTQTGVSRSVYYAFYDDDDGYFSGMCNLAQMINEAWYECKN